MADTSWLDGAPDAHWLDDAPDAAGPAKPVTPASESAARGVLQGLSLGFGDELSGALAAALPFAGREAVGKGKTFGERYHNARDFYRGKNKAAKEAHSTTYGGSELAGGIAGTVLSGGAGAAKALGLGARVLQGAKTGAGIGALYGAGSSEANTAGGLAGDAATGAAAGGASGGVLPLVTAAVGRVAGPVSDWLKNRAIESGRKALSGIGTSLSARKPIDAAAVEQALQTGAIRPLGTVAGTAERLGAQADELGAQYGQILKELEAQGVRGPNAVLLAQKLAGQADEAARTSLGSARPKMLQSVAEELPSKVDPAPFADKRLGLLQSEEIKRNLQQEAQREYDKISRQYTTAGDTKKEIASTMRQAIEDAVQEQASKAPDAAAQFQPVKARLSRTYEALKAAEEGAARAARRKHVSLTSTIVGTGLGEATGSPITGILGALAHGVTDRRLASTAASTQYGLSNLLSRAATPMSPAAAGETSQIAALIAALRGSEGRLSPAMAGAEEGSP